MQPARHPVSRRRHARRLAVSSVVLATLAGTALLFQGTAAAVGLGRTTLTAPLPKSSPGLPRLDPRLALLARSLQASLGEARPRPVSSASRLQRGRVRVDVCPRATCRRPLPPSVSLGGTIRMTWRTHVERARAARVAGRRSPGPPPSRSSACRRQGPRRPSRARRSRPAWRPRCRRRESPARASRSRSSTGASSAFSSLQSSGDIPANVTTGDFCGGRFLQFATEHGTAVTEIVHEMAPDAQLYLACTERRGLGARRRALGEERGECGSSTSPSATSLSGRGDGSGIVGSAAADARANGILWVSAAGNHAQEHWSATFDGRERQRLPSTSRPATRRTASSSTAARASAESSSGTSGRSRSRTSTSASTPTRTSFSPSRTNTQNGSQPPVERRATGTTTGGLQTVGWAIFGANVVSTPRIDLFSVGISEPLQYQTAAGQHRRPGHVARGARRRRGLLAEQRARVLQLAGPHDRRPRQARHRRPGQRLERDVRAVLRLVPVGLRGYVGRVADRRRSGRAGRAGEPVLQGAQLQAFLQQKAAVDIGAPGVDDQSGAGALRLPTTLTRFPTGRAPRPGRCRARASAGTS